LHRLGALAAVCDESAGVAAELSERHDAPSMSLEQVLADDAIDAVTIATPAVTHGQLSIRCLEHGKHVFVEKTMAVDVAEAQLVADRAAALNKRLMVGHLLQYHAAFLRLRELVDAGAIGALRYVYSNRLSFGQIRNEENSLWSFAPHDISMILSLMGEAPRAVSAVGAAFVQSHLADVTTTHMDFSGGRHAHVFVSWLHPYKEQRLVVVGEEGMLEFNDQNDWPEKVKLYPHQVDFTGEMPIALKAEAKPVDVAAVEPLLEEMRHFVTCVQTGEQPRTHGQEGIAVLGVLNAAQRDLDRQFEARLKP
jgi:UDP-2-acetamido-3-amino-2,3-dideoxy-glucuronate N-acetyltransferase